MKWMFQIILLMTIAPFMASAAALAERNVYPARDEVVRDGQYLLRLNIGGTPEVELYDIKQDPERRRNLAGERRVRGIEEDLRALLESKLRAARDPRLPTKGYRVRTMEGWTLFIDERLLKNEAGATSHALGLMNKHLDGIVKAVPGPALARLRTVPLWLSPRYPGLGPKAEYHPGAGWLREHGRNPAMAKGVEFTNIGIFDKETRRMPVFVLHELAHAFHEQVYGFDDPEIKAAYRRAVEGKHYEAVKNNAGQTRRAYAMTNPMEYFAEESEAFFGVNDFYPFTREELERLDPEMARLLERLWGVAGQGALEIRR